MTETVEENIKTHPAVAWWKESIENRTSPRARTLRAKLRRAETAVEILSNPEVHQLAKWLKLSPDDAPKVVRLARVLAHVENDQPALKPARAFGALSPDGKLKERPNLSQLRFERIVQETNPDTAVDLITRALPIIDRRCSVKDLADAILWWGDSVRTRWCFDYFQTFVPQTSEKD